ncbi:MAG: transposase [Chitinophagales bacterium]|jgi:putative transposase|nr:transposase [Chitinophagales bacterium]
MSTKYKFRDSQKLYFISYATVYWIDVFIRAEYSQIWVDSVNYCSAHKDLDVFAYCLMPSHVHMIVSSPTGQLSNIMRDLKKHTSLKIIEAIQLNSQESRKEWMLAMFKEAGNIKSNTSRYQFWQHESHPIELVSNDIMQQKLDYIHNNPVVAGFVDNAMDWKYSSAGDYCGKKGCVEIKLIE